jgi:glycerol-3-phosphate dehydrogenase
MNRAAQITALKNTPYWDVVVIGGGATGLGAAVDAASRGLKTLLLEKYDFAKGTSSRSTKLFHGGVRYLAQGNIKLVREALKERGILLKNAPHLSGILNFVIPSIRWYDKYFYTIGLKIYDWLAGKYGIGKTIFINKKKIYNYLPTLTKKNINGGVVYADGQFDDARFAISLAATAVAQGATVLNYMNMVSFEKQNNIITGIVVEDTINKETYTIAAGVVINATGVFVEDILKLDHLPKQLIMPSQGVHIVVDKKHFTGNYAMMIPKTKDGRVLFAIPWHDKVVLGTTDTAVNQITIEPMALTEEVDFIMDHFNAYNATSISKKEVLSVFVGLRPLINKKQQKETASISREHSIFISSAQLITITGGKWTTYRKMAADVVDKVFPFLSINYKPCITADIPLAGYTTQKSISAVLQVYGTEEDKILKLIQTDSSLADLIHPHYPYTKAQVVYAIQEEMAMTIEDVLARRIRLLFLDAQAAIDAAPVVASLLTAYLEKSSLWETEQIKDFILLASNYLLH